MLQRKSQYNVSITRAVQGNVGILQFRRILSNTPPPLERYKERIFFHRTSIYLHPPKWVESTWTILGCSKLLPSFRANGAQVGESVNNQLQSWKWRWYEKVRWLCDLFWFLFASNCTSMFYSQEYITPRAMPTTLWSRSIFDLSQVVSPRGWFVFQTKKKRQRGVVNCRF